MRTGRHTNQKPAPRERWERQRDRERKHENERENFNHKNSKHKNENSPSPTTRSRLGHNSSNMTASTNNIIIREGNAREKSERQRLERVRTEQQKRLVRTTQQHSRARQDQEEEEESRVFERRQQQRYHDSAVRKVGGRGRADQMLALLYGESVGQLVSWSVVHNRHIQYYTIQCDSISHNIEFSHMTFLFDFKVISYGTWVRGESYNTTEHPISRNVLFFHTG